MSQMLQITTITGRTISRRVSDEELADFWQILASTPTAGYLKFPADKKGRTDMIRIQSIESAIAVPHDIGEPVAMFAKRAGRA